MKTIKTKNGEVLLIKVPEKSIDFKLATFSNLIICLSFYSDKYPERFEGFNTCDSRFLLKGSVNDYKIIGKFSELEDKDFEEFVEITHTGGCDIGDAQLTQIVYKDYLLKKVGKLYFSAKQSFQSLCVSQGVEDDLNNYLIIKKL